MSPELTWHLHLFRFATPLVSGTGLEIRRSYCQSHWFLLKIFTFLQWQMSISYPVYTMGTCSMQCCLYSVSGTTTWTVFQHVAVAKAHQSITSDYGNRYRSGRALRFGMADSNYVLESSIKPPVVTNFQSQIWQTAGLSGKVASQILEDRQTASFLFCY